MPDNVLPLILAVAAFGLVVLAIVVLSDQQSLNGIKSRTVGDGQHGTARWASVDEIHRTFARVPFRPKLWRKRADARPKTQGLILGCESKRVLKSWRDVRSKRWRVTALVDSDDIHCLMIGASGIGKTAFFLYPNLEYACASGMSFLALDTKGDLARNYGAVAKEHYGYNVAVIDLRNPTRSDGYNLLTLINHYMDVVRENPGNLAARAKAEKYAKIFAKTIINPDDDASQYGQNSFFYDAAEGLLAAVVLVLAEFLPPTPSDPSERRHVVSVFKLIQEMLEPPSNPKQKNGFAALMDALPPAHKAKWFAGAALGSADQAMLSVMSTVLSRELFAVADENGGALKNRVVFFCDELGTMPAFDILPLFSAGRSRKLTLVPIIQSLAQLEKNYGKEGAEIITDNCQDTIFGGFAPNSQTAEVLSKALGNQTILSGSVSKGKESSRTLQMIRRPLMTPDELKSIPKGSFVVMKTGTHPMRTRLRLFLEWGITFGKPYILPERAARKVAYADKDMLMRRVREANPSASAPKGGARNVSSGGGMLSAGEQAQTESELTAAQAKKAVAYHYGKKDYAQ